MKLKCHEITEKNIQTKLKGKSLNRKILKAARDTCKTYKISGIIITQLIGFSIITTKGKNIK